MATINFELLDNWIETTLQKIDGVNSFGDDIHINDLILEKTNAPKDLLDSSVQCILHLFNSIQLRNFKKEIVAELNIELRLNNEKVFVVPTSIEDIQKQINTDEDIHLSLGSPQKSIFNPSLEYYCIPVECIIDKYFSENETLNVYYSAYRTIEEKRDNGAFERWISFVVSGSVSF